MQGVNLNKFTKSWTELKTAYDWYFRVFFIGTQYFYNEEFDPGSGWTLATGLTHASRGAALE